jgi:phage terminase large subunit-like protein
MSVAHDDLLEELELLLRAEELYRKLNKFESMYPETGPLSRDKYAVQTAFFEGGATYRERAFLGGNGVGKSEGVGAYEVTLHATGRYPAWWNGRRFDGPVEIWVAGDTRETVRDITQTKLLGSIAKEGMDVLGTGMLPKDSIKDVKFVQNTNRAADYCTIRHITGGLSVISFKSYDQRREAFQGTEKEVIWLDEEPPMDIYLECLMRGRTVEGMILLTFTPLSGITDVVKSFLNYEKLNKDGASKMRWICSWDDVPHLSEKEKVEMLASCPVYLRDARRKGIPTAGIGKVYVTEEDQFVVKPFQLPTHWRRCFGFDGGWHNTACIWLAWDKDNDVAYLYSEYKRGEQSIEVHAAALRARGAWIPGVGDAAAIGQDNGKKLLSLYKATGINMVLPDKSVDAGIQIVLSRLETGRLKVFSTCQKWLEEYRMYRYDEKQRIVKQDDHLMDATRYGLISGLKRSTTQQIERLHIPQVRF